MIKTKFFMYFFEQVNQSEKKLTFMDVNTDVQLTILEELRDVDLLSVAQTNEHFSRLAAYVFSRKHPNANIEINDPESDARPDILDLTHLRNAEMVSNVLKHFGTSIAKLRVVYLSDEKDSNITLVRTANGQINLQCAKSLVEIDIDSYFESFFDEMTRPFERVENVTIYGQFKKLGNSNMTLAEIFPVMKRLVTSKLEISDKSGIDQEYPHLEHLGVIIHYNDDPLRLTEADVIKILRKNPQIRSLKLHCDNLTILQTVNELLPNLEILEFSSHPSHSDVIIENDINFKNVKILTLYPSHKVIPENLRFENLEELHSDAFPGSSNWGIKLASQSKALQRLYIDLGCIDTIDLEMIISANFTLAEISLNICLSCEDERIVQFIENSHQIKVFRMNSLPESSVQFIQENLGNKWKTNSTSIRKMYASSKLLIERKEKNG